MTAFFYFAFEVKKVLVLYYTQSGQQRRILESITRPLADNGAEICWEEILPADPYPFPWSAYQFFNAFPETFKQQPLPLKPLSSNAYADYDLIILGYQPWFLTPSRPVSSFLQSDDGKRILSNRYVITVLGCRNMWLGAQEKVKHWLRLANAKWIGHIALVDKGGNLTSLITILHWMLTGKKEPFWIFPEAGVAKKEVENARHFGDVILKSFNENRLDQLQRDLNAVGAIDIKPNLVLMEKRGQKSFSVWAKFVAAGGAVHSAGRTVRVYVFMYLLPTMIFILTPLLWIVSRIQLALMKKQLQAEIEYYRSTAGRTSSDPGSETPSNAITQSAR